MRMRKSTRVTLLAFLALLTACTGAKLNTLDEDFERLYAAKAESRQNDDSAAAVAADFDLLELSKEADTAGDEVAGEDWKTAVAFYRVAALSAWQTGEDGEVKILPITNKGQSLCKGRVDDAPRDCILMMIIAPLAIHDDLARDFVPIQAKSRIVVKDRNVKFTEKELEKMVDVFDGVAIQFNKLSVVRNQADNSRAPRSLGRYIDRQQLLLYCTANAARDTMSLAKEFKGPKKQQERTDDIKEMRADVEKQIGNSDCPTG